MSQAEIIPASDRLAKRMGPKIRLFTTALLRKAEAAFGQISANFDNWLQSDVTALELSWIQATRSGLTQPQLQAISSQARGLRSAGSSLGFPIVSRLAVSLCRLLEGEPKLDPALIALVTSHIEAIKAALRNNIRSPDDHPVVNAIAQELEDQVSAVRDRV